MLTPRKAPTNTLEASETKSSFARRLGVSRQAVGKYCDDPTFPIDESGNVRIKAGLAWAASNLGRVAAGEADGKAKGKEPASLIERRIELLGIQIERGKLALASEQRESIPYSEARRALAAFMRMHRDMSLRFAVRYGPAIAAELGCDEDALIIALEMRMREAMNEAFENARPFPRKDPAHEPA